MSIKHELWMLGKAEASASVASIVDFGLVILLKETGIMAYSLANIIGVVCGGITNCCINYRYVFRSSTRGKKSVAWRYFLVWAGSMAFNGLGTNLLTSLTSNNLFYAIKCIVAFVVAVCFNYPLQRKFVFSSEK